MFKKTFTYQDVDDKPRTKTVEFHMSKAAFIKFNRTPEARKLEEWTNLTNEATSKHLTEERKKELDTILGQLVYDLLDIFVRLSYGHRVTDPDGANPRFERDSEETKRFLESDEYGDFEYQLLTNPAEFTEFIGGLVPNDLKQSINKGTTKAIAEGASNLEVNGQNISLTPEVIAQLSAMTAAQKPAIAAE